MFEQFLTATRELIAIDSVESAPAPNAPFGVGVRSALDYTLDLCAKLGFKVTDGEGYYGYAEVGEGELFGMLGHLDTVPIGKYWTKPPLGGVVEKGVMYGRGLLDDKAPILACLFATAELIASGKRPTHRARVIFGCDEESGWKCMDRYLEREELPALAFTPDGDFPVINCEKGIVYHDVAFPAPSYILDIHGGDRPNMVMDNVEVKIRDISAINPDFCADNGVTLVGDTLSAKGVSAHGSTPNKGDNALWKVIRVLSKAYGGDFAKLEKIVTNTDGSGYGLVLHDEVSGDLTINIGAIYMDGGTIHFSLDIRYPISYERDFITEELQKALGGFAVTQGFYHNPLFIAQDHPLVVKLQDAYEEVAGIRLAPISIGGGTYARALPTAVAFGPIFPGQESTIHQKDECCSLDNLRKMYDIYKRAIEKLCFE